MTHARSLSDFSLLFFSYVVVAAVALLLLGLPFVFTGLGELHAPDPETAPRVVARVGGGLAAMGGPVLVALNALYRCC